MAPIKHGNSSVELVSGRTLFDYADALKIRVPTSCGRSGKCHECIVEVHNGMDAICDLTNEEEFLRGNYRLACQATVVNPGVEIDFGVLRRQPKILEDSINREVKLDPMTFRKGDYIYFQDNRIDTYRGSIIGLAIDLGTTSVVINLTDLESGSTLHRASFENPQRFGGSDIMHRISYDGGVYGGELQKVIVSSINFEIGEMCKRLKLRRRQIYEAVVVGNSTMRDILFGVDVQSIGEKPYKSLTELDMERSERSTTSLNSKAVELGVRIFPDANIYSGPLLSCHVGADVAADLLAIGMDTQENVVMLVDVGTNTEVVVGNRDKMLVASCPAGPAFEGGQVTFGMPGYNGAIESVQINGDDISYRTIGGLVPQGICGSGLVDLLAELRRNRMMNALGVFADGSDRVMLGVDQEMYLSRSDVSSLAQAKSANYSGQKIILDRYGITANKIATLYLAGGFANYVNVENAMSIGFIANVRLDRVVKVGNAALKGAEIMLISGGMRQVVESMAQRIEHVELETSSDFFDIFVDGCQFNPMDA